MSQFREPKRLDFVMTEDGPVLLISFFGDIEVATLQDVERHAIPVVSTEKIRFVAFNFQSVQSMERQSISLFVRFKTRLNELGKTIRLCNLELDLKLILESHGAISGSEDVDTLMEAMRAFERIRRGA